MIKTQLNTKLLTYNFEELFKKKGYAYFTKGAYNLNIIGIRNNTTSQVSNKFDDYIVVTYRTNIGEWKRLIFPATTKPGLTVFKNPTNVKGAPILVPNQYRGTWMIGKHRGKYKALCQCKSVKVYRDNNKNDIIDLLPETIDEGMFGINIHKSSDFRLPDYVNNWSAGCQVLQSLSNFNTLMSLADKQVKQGLGNKFTYTLLNASEL